MLVISFHSLQPFVCIYFVSFFQDDASGVLRRPALRVEAAGGPALVPGSPGHPDLLPGERRMEIRADLRQNSWQRLTVSVFSVVRRLREHWTRGR